MGKDEFDSRREEIFRGVFQGTKLNLSIKTLRFVRSDVAIADIDATLVGCLAKPPGVNVGPDGVLHACLLMVLLKQNHCWWIAAYHNVWRSESLRPWGSH